MLSIVLLDASDIGRVIAFTMPASVSKFNEPVMRFPIVVEAVFVSNVATPEPIVIRPVVSMERNGLEDVANVAAEVEAR